MERCKVKILGDGVPAKLVMGENEYSLGSGSPQRACVLCLIVRDDKGIAVSAEALKLVGPTLIEVDGEKMIGVMLEFCEFGKMVTLTEGIFQQVQGEVVAGYWDSAKMAERG